MIPFKTNSVELNWTELSNREVSANQAAAARNRARFLANAANKAKPVTFWTRVMEWVRND